MGVIDETDAAWRLIAGLRRLNRLVAVAVGVVLLACAGLVLIDIVMRRLGASLGGTDEISGYVMAVATAWGMAYALGELAHVRIDLLRTRVRGRPRALLDVAVMAVTAATVTFIAWRAWPVVERSLANGSRANTPLETPLALVQVPWMAGWVWFALCATALTFAAGSLALRGYQAAAEAAIGTPQAEGVVDAAPETDRRHR